MDNQNDRYQCHLRQWLQYLFFAYIFGIAVSLAEFVPALTGVLPILSHLISVVVIVCLFMLGKAVPRYRKAALFTAFSWGIQLADSLLSAVVTSDNLLISIQGSVGFALTSGVLMVVGSVYSFAAMYQTYTAHGEVCKPCERKLAENWKRLFWWTLAVGVGASLGMFAFGILELTAVAVLITLLYGIATMVFEVLRILWLRRMVRMLEK